MSLLETDITYILNSCLPYLALITKRSFIKVTFRSFGHKTGET